MSDAAQIEIVPAWRIILFAALSAAAFALFCGDAGAQVIGSMLFMVSYLLTQPYRDVRNDYCTPISCRQALCIFGGLAFFVLLSALLNWLTGPNEPRQPAAATPAWKICSAAGLWLLVNGAVLRRWRRSWLATARS